MTTQEKAAGYFDQHPTENEFHFTSDGQAFIKMDDAELHAESLKSKTIETVKRFPDPTILPPPQAITIINTTQPPTVDELAKTVLSDAAIDSIKENAAKENQKKAAAKKAAAKAG